MPIDLLIRGGSIYDGTGAQPYQADVADGGMIREVMSAALNEPAGWGALPGCWSGSTGRPFRDVLESLEYENRRRPMFQVEPDATW